MIGLGSNRLTVCRRGGMSVTQAGRGGMEWLGSREPSWASPYSAAATAALKAVFTAAQWVTIRDYGFAHPEIVGYMNAYAPEDAKIAYSLVEGIGTRTLDSNATAYIDTGVIFANNNKRVETQLRIYGDVTNSHIYGSADGSSMWTLNPWWNGSTWTTYVKNAGYNAKTISKNVVHEFDNEIANGVLNTTLDGTTETANVTPYNAARTLWLFHCNTPVSGYTVSNIGFGKVIIWDGDTKVREMYPFIRKINGVDTCGMIDVLSGTFYQNAGSGSFTISETPAS